MGAVIEKFETAVTANGTVFRVGTILSRPTLVLAGVGTRPHVHVARSWQTPGSRCELPGAGMLDGKTVAVLLLEA